MTELVTIPVSVFDIVIDYEYPDVRLWTDRATVFDVMFKAFMPWGIDIDDIDVIEQGKNSDRGLRYRMPGRKASFFFGASYCRFTQDDANWNTAQASLAILNAGVSTLMETAKVKKATQHTSLALHLQLKTGRFIDILSPFVPSQLGSLTESPLVTVASVVKWGDRKVYIDGSGSWANAVFLKLDRDFSSAYAFDQIAEQIFEDQGTLFHIMGVEEDT